MSTDRPDRFSDRIAELWNDRPRSDRRAERLSRDHSLENSFDPPVPETPSDRPVANHDSTGLPAAESSSTDRFFDHPADRYNARFSDLEPLMPASAAPTTAPTLSGLIDPDSGRPTNSTLKPNPNLSPSPVSATAPDPVKSATTTSDPIPNRIRSWAPQPNQPTPRAVGSPLPTGSAPASAPSFPTAPQAQVPSQRATSPALPDKPLALGRGLPPSEANIAQLPSDSELPSSVQKVISAVRATLPFIQRILPLLDGNIGTAVSNLMAPPAQPTHRPAPPPPPSPPLDLAPLEEGISSLQSQQRELRSQIVEQNTSLKRVEDQLEMVREATDRNTLEQQELLEDLKGIGNRVNIFAMVALLLLVVSVMVNVILYLHIKRVLP